MRGHNREAAACPAYLQASMHALLDMIFVLDMMLSVTAMMIMMMMMHMMVKCLT